MPLPYNSVVIVRSVVGSDVEVGAEAGDEDFKKRGSLNDAPGSLGQRGGGGGDVRPH